MRLGCCERLRCYFAGSIHLIVEEAKFVRLDPPAGGPMNTVPNDKTRYDLGRPTDGFRMNGWTQEGGVELVTLEAALEYCQTADSSPPAPWESLPMTCPGLQGWMLAPRFQRFEHNISRSLKT